MKNTIKNIFTAMVSLSLTLSLTLPLTLPLAQTVSAAEYDSSALLPPMAAAMQATRSAGKDFVDYQGLRRREAEIFAELTSPAFEKQIRQVREKRRAELLVELGNLSANQNERLKSYKQHLGYAIEAYGKVGPAQLGGARAHLEGLRTAMAADIERQSVAASALADTARLGGMTPQQRKDFKNYADQLRRKRGMEAHLQASGRQLESQTAGVDALIGYLGEMRDGIDISIFETEANIAFNTGAKAVHVINELTREMCGDMPCTPDLFGSGPDHSVLMGGIAVEQPEAGGAEKSTDDAIDLYGRK